MVPGSQRDTHVSSGKHKKKNAKLSNSLYFFKFCKRMKNVRSEVEKDYVYFFVVFTFPVEEHGGIKIY